MKISAFILLTSVSLLIAEALDEIRIVLTDADNATFRNMHKASYMPCIQDSHGDMFHHGQQFFGSNPTSALFTFEPPADGCYTIEEWHPGWNKLCNRYLQDAVLLEVTYGLRKRAYTYVEQSMNNGQWNMLGALPFKKGITGHLMLKGTRSSCSEGNNCFWAADAFKLTRISDSATGCILPEQLLTPDQVVQANPAHPQVIVDDSQVVAAGSNWNLYLGMRPGGVPGMCGHEGWSNSFRYLNPKQSQRIEEPFEFVFQPPQDGCYLVEEFHPSSVCSYEMTSTAQLSIGYCRNKTVRVAVDQTKDGNQWNTVALLPFYRGHDVSIAVLHPQVGTGVAAADAFRFTMVADTCPQARPRLPQYLRLAQHPTSVTADDSSANIEGIPTLFAHQCDRTAYLGKTRAIGNKATSAVFSFMPPSTGCYRIDEFHPESHRYCFLGDADLTVEYCLGKSWRGNISLGKDGARWNTVGHFPFYAGIPGKVTSQAKVGNNPAQWVADAFRFTRVSDTCSVVPHSALLTLRLIGIDLTDVQLPDGKLTTNTDQRLAFHEAIVDVAGLQNSQVRLLGLRAGSIIAEFEFQGKEEEVTAAVKRVEVALWQHGHGSLEERLCEAATVGKERMPCRAWLIRTTAVRGWEKQAVEAPGTRLPLWACIAVGCAIFFACIGVMAAVFIRIKRRQRAKTQKEAETSNCKEDVEATSKDTKDNISDSASTATPDRVNCCVQTEMTGELFDLDAISNFDFENKDEHDMTDQEAPNTVSAAGI